MGLNFEKTTGRLTTHGTTLQGRENGREVPRDGSRRDISLEGAKGTRVAGGGVGGGKGTVRVFVKAVVRSDGGVKGDWGLSTRHTGQDGNEDRLETGVKRKQKPQQRKPGCAHKAPEGTGRKKGET